MTSSDKAFAICATAMFLGIGGSLVVGWPSLIAAAVAIAAIALAPSTTEAPGHGE